MLGKKNESLQKSNKMKRPKETWWRMVEKEINNNFQQKQENGEAPHIKYENNVIYHC